MPRSRAPLGSPFQPTVKEEEEEDAAVGTSVAALSRAPGQPPLCTRGISCPPDGKHIKHSKQRVGYPSSATYSFLLVLLVERPRAVGKVGQRGSLEEGSGRVPPLLESALHLTPQAAGWAGWAGCGEARGSGGKGSSGEAEHIPRQIESLGKDP